MKTLLKGLVGGTLIALTTATAASAFTTWDSFKYNGYTVKARYADGNLRYIMAKNPVTGDQFAGRVTLDGIAVIETADGPRRYDINALEKRFDGMTEMRDLAQVD